ncbi:MAG: chorismate synthase [Dehalococcoidia bacterium]|nr:chorismate synthase [Dehalococcoidia bacterium]MDD5493213.1 chorismate synthase [Dehalococcoidia bacterium]
MSNSLGKLFVVTSFGESHGRCVGAVVDGCPAGLALSVEDVQKEVDRRKASNSAGSTGRREEDKAEIISGIFNNITTGAPICMIIWNRDIDSSAYEKTRFIPRPGHADYTAYIKYGGFNDYRGGGRFSGRITAGYVMAGAVARKLLSLISIEVLAHTVQIGAIKAGKVPQDKIRDAANRSPVGCADANASEKMVSLIQEVTGQGDSIGGIIEALALNVPVGLGEPVFDTLEGALAGAFFSIPAVKGVEFGSGFLSAGEKGSENNDPFTIENNRIATKTNNSGGVLGGISNGMPVVARIAVKPTASIAQNQQTVNMKTLQNSNIAVHGRHDACIVPRAVPVVEAMMAITLCDLSIRAGLIPEVIK